MTKVNERLIKDELIKFFELSREKIDDLKMPRCIIDEYWHELLELENEYEKFCIKYAGRIIFHEKSGGEEVLEWVKRYEQNYGVLSPLWFTDKFRELDIKSYEQYKQSGIVKLSWDCQPAIRDN